MSLHRLASVTVGVPNPAPVADFYAEFGLTVDDAGWFSTTDGGRQLQLVEAPTRRLVGICIECDGPDDLDRIAAGLACADAPAELAGDRLWACEMATGVEATVTVAERKQQPVVTPVPTNGPGRIERWGQRSNAVLRNTPVRPRRLGHVVITTPDLDRTAYFFRELLGFKVSDFLGNVGLFLRCSTDHHNLLILSAGVSYLHHTAWQVDDVDDVGRGAFALLQDHPERHVWGLGRHHAGSNFFWYLRDPAGNFAEYYADLDVIPDDGAWVPEVHSGRLGLYSWGPQPPPTFLEPEDYAELVAWRKRPMASPPDGVTTSR